MKMSVISCAAATLGAVAFGLSPMPVSAAVVDFESKAPFYCELANQSDGGLDFSHNFAACFYGPGEPADFPSVPPSVVMGIGFSDTTVTRTGGGAFDLLSVDLAFGPFDHGGANSNTTLVTGFLQGGGTVSTLLTVDYTFDTYLLNWANLTSVVFGELQPDSEYLAFDNLVYNAAVPEPGTLALLGLGLAGLGLSRRRKAN